MKQIKDLIVGAADKYSWNQIRNWIVSIEKSGFEGDVVLLAYRIDDMTLRQCLQHPKMTVIQCTTDSWAKPIDHNAKGRDTQSHQMRFFHLWQFLKERCTQGGFYPVSESGFYRYVIVTDVRDVVFQSNPSQWFNQFAVQPDMFAPSEGIEYQDEPWGKENMLSGFGPYAYEDMKTRRICNVGTIAIHGDIAGHVAMNLYLLGENRYIPNDQSGFNWFIYHQMNISPETVAVVTEEFAWACQVGTMDDPAKPFLWEKLKEARPTLKADGVYNSLGEKFVIVHQYDRNPAYNAYFNKLFGEP